MVLLITKAMIRVKFIKDHNNHKAGDIDVVGNNEAFGLIDAGFAVVSKDMTSGDYKTTSTLTPQPSVLTTPKTKNNNRR